MRGEATAGGFLAPAPASDLTLDLTSTVDWIRATQRADGAIPWYPEGPLDPWDHVEAAMALDAAGDHAAAARALDWLARTQRPDGSWPWRTLRGRAVEHTGDANHATYLAVGAWHHLLCTADRARVDRWWPAVVRGVGFALTLQDRHGVVRWARAPSGRAAPDGLVSGGAATLLGLRCAAALAAARGAPRPRWEHAARRLAGALAAGAPTLPAPGRHAMDWYWPVLAGVVTETEGVARLRRGWNRFVWPGHGVRCVDDRPWVTGAETCELVMALARCGERDVARRLLGWAAELRGPDGAWWTGAVWPSGVRWPVERTTWTGAAAVLATDCLEPGSRILAVLRTGG